jgi:hypothetical protein
MRIRIIVLIAVAIGLGIASWFVADGSPDMSTFTSAWFFWLAGWVHYWVWPDSATGLMAMTMAVYTVQYLVLFTLLTALAPIGRLVQDFMRPHKHRGGLLNRRA